MTGREERPPSDPIEALRIQYKDNEQAIIALEHALKAGLPADEISSLMSDTFHPEEDYSLPEKESKPPTK